MLISVDYNNPEAIRLISSQSNSPVFGYTDVGIGDGASEVILQALRKLDFLWARLLLKFLMVLIRIQLRFLSWIYLNIFLTGENLKDGI